MELNPMVENARMWVVRTVHKERHESILLALAYVVVSAISITAGLWLFNWLYGAFGLLLIAIAYFVCGGFRAAEPAINAQTIRPRLTGVARMQNLAWWGPEQIRREMAFVLACLMTPVHLLVESWRLVQRRRRLAFLDEDAASELAARIVACCGAVVVDLRDQDSMRGLLSLRDLPGCVLLSNPDRVTLVESAMLAIRSE